MVDIKTEILVSINSALQVDIVMLCEISAGDKII